MLNNIINERIDEVIKCITDSVEYKNCIRIKKIMNDNSSLKSQINRVKELQKQYIRSQDKKIKDELEEEMTRLNSIPIYVEYLNNLEEVNRMINLVKDELNDYFYNKLNKVVNF